MESEFYKKEYLELEKKLNQLPNSVLSNISIKITDGTHFTPKYTEEGVTFLSALNVLENKVVLSAGHRYISMEEHRQLYGRCDPKAGDILLRKVGVGARFAAVVPSGLPEFSVFVSLALIRPAKNIYPRFLSTFINTKIGQSQLIRVQKGASQPDLHLEDIQTLVVPTLGDNFQRSVELIVSNADTIVKLSIEKYAEAELLLLTEIGFDGFVPSAENINTKAYSESFLSSGRLDSEYYLPKYEQVVGHIRKGKFDVLSHLVTIKKSIEPGSSAYADEGLPFIRVSDYDKFGITTPDKYLSDAYYKENADTLNKLKPKKETILFSKDGSVGIAHMLTEDLNGVTSGAILHLHVKDKQEVLPEYLTLVLNSQLVQMQAERDAGGSIILHWRVGEIENVIVPIVAMDKQKEIKDMINQSFEAKAKSESLLDIAKRAVEIAIEQDEAIAEHYIQDECLRLGVSLDMTKGTKY